MSWNLRYASQEILDRFSRGLTNFYGTQESPTGNRIVHQANEDGSGGRFIAIDAQGNQLGKRRYKFFSGENNHMHGADITNTSGHPGVGLALDHATAQHCNSIGATFNCTVATPYKTDSPTRPGQKLDASTYHTSVGRLQNPDSLIDARSWPKETMSSIAQLPGGPQ